MFTLCLVGWISKSLLALFNHTAHTILVHIGPVTTSLPRTLHPQMHKFLMSGFKTVREQEKSPLTVKLSNSTTKGIWGQKKISVSSTYEPGDLIWVLTVDFRPNYIIQLLWPPETHLCTVRLLCLNKSD